MHRRVRSRDEASRRYGDVDIAKQRECFGQNLYDKALMETLTWPHEREQIEVLNIRFRGYIPQLAK